MHVILVHGMSATPLTWSLVTPLLDEKGIAYSVADNASQSLEEDAARVRSMIDVASGPVLLVGHSYGGAVITHAGTHEAVRGLVYVAAWAPGAEESIKHLLERYPPSRISDFMERSDDGSWIPIETEEAREALAWDVPEDIWRQQSETRRPSADRIFATTTSRPAWAERPVWYIVAADDQHIQPELQREMAARAAATSCEVWTSHDIPHADPDVVAGVISTALAQLSTT